MIDRLARRLNLEPAELRRALTLAAMLFGITSSYTLVKTARDSLYLSQLPAHTLPYVYLGVGALTLGASHGFALLTRRWATWATLAVTAAGSAISLAIFVPLLDGREHWVAIAFYLWVNVYGLLLVSQFWAFTNSTSDPRAAKRTFGLIGTGGILGGLAGGIVASQVGRASGLGILVAIGAALVGLVTPVVVMGVRRGHTPVAGAAEVKTSESPWKSSYVRWLALAALCSVIVTGLLDYQLKVEAQGRYPSPHALAHFFGLFYTVMNLGALVVQFVITRWALQTLGAPWSAVVLPAGLGVGATLSILVPGTWTVVANRLWDQVIRLSLAKSASEIFYFPLEPALRRHAKAVVEAGLERIGDGLAGVLILAAGMTIGASTQVLGLLVAGVVALWLVAWFRLRAAYPRELGRGLRRLTVDPDQVETSLRERGLLRRLVRLLESPYERVVLHAIDLLEDNARKLLDYRLPRLIEHGSPRVRARALALIGESQSEEARATVKRLLNDPDPLVRIEALRAHCALGDGGANPALEAYLDAGDPQLRATALQCLVQFSSPDQEPHVRQILDRRLAEDAIEPRLEAILAIGQRAPPHPLHDLLLPLVQDRELEVRRAAFEVAGGTGRPEFVEPLIQALADRGVEKAACAGLIAMGGAVVPTLGERLADPETAIEIRRQIPKVLGQIPSTESARALAGCRDRGDLLLTYRLLKACNQIRTVDPAIEFPADVVREDLEYEIRAYLLTLLRRRAFPAASERSGDRFLARVLTERLDQTLNRIFRRLALIYPPRTTYAAWRSFQSGKGRAGNAVEYLETTLEPQDCERVLPLIDDTTEDQRVALAVESYGLSCDGEADALRGALDGDDPWLRVCALFVVGQRRDGSFADRVEANRESADPRVRDAASWALAALGKG